MGLQFQKTPVGFLFLIGRLMYFPTIHCGLHPYYLHFPPPLPVPVPVPNGIDIEFPRPPGWAFEHIPYHINTDASNSNGTTTRGGHLTSGPIPLILHTWVKSGISDGTKLQNGTVLYYVTGPWGGIRSDPPSTSQPPQKSNIELLSNSVSDTDYSTTSPSGGTKDVSQPPNHLSIDITPPPNRQQSQGPWGQGHFGFGWPSSTQLYDKIPETTTVSTRNQVPGSATTTSKPITSTNAGTTSSIPSVDPVAANTDGRFPVSDSVRKFRRIVAQIRAITKKELANTRKT